MALARQESAACVCRPYACVCRPIDFAGNVTHFESLNVQLQLPSSPTMIDAWRQVVRLCARHRSEPKIWRGCCWKARQARNSKITCKACSRHHRQVFGRVEERRVKSNVRFWSEEPFLLAVHVKETAGLLKLSTGWTSGCSCRVDRVGCCCWERVCNARHAGWKQSREPHTPATVQGRQTVYADFIYRKREGSCCRENTLSRRHRSGATGKVFAHGNWPFWRAQWPAKPSATDSDERGNENKYKKPVSIEACVTFRPLSGACSGLRLYYVARNRQQGHPQREVPLSVRRRWDILPARPASCKTIACYRSTLLDTRFCFVVVYDM